MKGNKTDSIVKPVITEKPFQATRNACKLCSPLGASLVFKGIKGCVPLIHGSQGCATYIRRYMISHYKEPVDIASSNFSEETTVFGGKQNFNTGLDNVISQYKPEVIAVATTCLSETIGEDVDLLLSQYKAERKNETLPFFVNASTPSYSGTHIDGFHEAVYASVKAFANTSGKAGAINLFPGFLSPADLRYLKEIFTDMGLDLILFPDYSESLDNPTWEEYHRIPMGGTPVEDIQRTGSSVASIEFGEVLNAGRYFEKEAHNNYSAAKYLQEKFNVDRFNLRIPLCIEDTDHFFNKLFAITGISVPQKYRDERGRLIDSYADGHKYVFGKKVVIYGEEDLVISMTKWLKEIGMEPVLCASGGKSPIFQESIRKIVDNDLTVIKTGTDFEEIAELAKTLDPDILIGNSKGYYIARELQIPIVRVGFPIHDRIGGQRIMHIGYRGAQQLFDTIVNTLLEYKQQNSPIGYKYM